ILVLHAAWLAALWWWAPGQPISIPFLVLFAILQAGRVWVIRSLGERWTTRIIVKPGAPLVHRGPYRFVNHPNYMIVTAEIAVLPLVFGLWQIALIFSALNALILTVRIRAENRALASLRGWQFTPISQLSPRHRQMPEAGAPRLRSQDHLA